MTHRFYILLVVLLLLPAGSVYALPGTLSGAASLRYAQHSAEEAGATVLDASHFIQSYSLLWEREGVLNKGRLGEYDIAFGYEWNWVDSEINNASVVIDNPLDKILFRGDLLLAPGGLPVRLNLYSHDMNRTSFVEQQQGELFRDQDYDYQYGIVNSIHNGSWITSGLTLVAGEKNGFYRGNYRDLFNSMPRLLIDFMQVDVDDTKGPDPINYTDRNLAFVSLNKNKNWFHYRMSTHEDKIDPSNDFERQSLLIGTIDHVNRREWIDLTNWIQVSSDLSYTETDSAGARELDQQRYDFNLFTTAQRANWRGGVYTSYQRIRDDRSLEKILEVPIVANGDLSRHTKWRFRLESKQRDEDFFSAAVNRREETNLYAAAGLEMFQQSRLLVSPKLESEYKDGDEGSGIALRTGVEAYSNPRYRDDRELFGSYLLTVINGKSEFDQDVSYWEQELRGRAAYDLNPDLRTGVEQELVFGSGTYQGTVTDFIGASINVLDNNAGATNGLIDGQYFRSISSWYIDHRPASRIYNRLELSFDYIDSAVDSGGQFIAYHNLNYYGRSLSASMDNELVFGNSLHDSFNADVDLIGSSGIVRQSGVVTSSFEHRSRLDYDPDRRHHHSLELELEWREFDSGGSDQRYMFEQLYQYTFWKDRGLLRKIAVLGEELEYENYSPSVSDSKSLLSFTLFSEIYPTRQTLFGVRLRYELDTTDETDTMLVFLTAGIDFQKFQMEFDYAYGTRTAGVNKPERVEHKWEMQVKKIF